MAKKRNGRHEAIRQIVRDDAIRTQRDLVQKLRQMGFNCTQATVSRDIADMGLEKLSEGRYALSEDLYLQRMVVDFVLGVESVENQVVINTEASTAPGIGSAIDAAGLTDVIGTIAGYNTVLVICRNTKAAGSVAEHICKIRGE
jgi:transcriptional regulator of arginine metabolism